MALEPPATDLSLSVTSDPRYSNSKEGWTSKPNLGSSPRIGLTCSPIRIIWSYPKELLTTQQKRSFGVMQSNAPFSQDDAREMTDLIKTVADLKRPVLKTWYCATVLRAICNNRLASHYGQNDAREVRRKEKAEDIESALPYGSLWNKFSWYLITSLLFGIPQRYLRRINNVDRTQSGNGVNTLRWRSFLKSICKEWTDSNLLATVLVSATVALLAIQGLNGTTVIASLIAALHALSSVLSGMLLVSNHQDRVESFGITGLNYFARAKSRTTGTVRPLAVLLSLPVAFMLWAMVWFIFAVTSCAYNFPQSGQTTPFPVTAVRVISLLFLGILGIIGAVLLWFYHGIWKIPTSIELQIQPPSTTVNMVTGQGGNQVMSFSGDQPPGSQPSAPALHIPEPALGSHVPHMTARLRPPSPPASFKPTTNPVVINAYSEPPTATSAAWPSPPGFVPPPPSPSPSRAPVSPPPPFRPTTNPVVINAHPEPPTATSATWPSPGFVPALPPPLPSRAPVSPPPPCRPTTIPVVINAHPEPPTATSAAWPSPPGFAPPPPPPLPSRARVAESEFKLTLTIADSVSWKLAIQDEATYNQMITDVRQECEKYGRIHDVLIPKYSPLAQVSVLFDSQASASIAFAVFKDNGLVGYQVS
ncbi:hypothetical protein RhiJN_22562 [Ceratobasidium sp. AG-Ba]|nr:hypothetical protein RhiJN_22562 [Ceratobasidium sp. AG-Ba]